VAGKAAVAAAAPPADPSATPWCGIKMAQG